MKNLLQQQYELETLSDQDIANEIQSPSGLFPPFLIATEVQRRQDMRNRFMQEQQKSAANQPTVMERKVAEMGIASIPGGVPREMMVQMGPQAMGGQGPAAGGIAALSGPQVPVSPEPPMRGFQEGGLVQSMGLYDLMDPVGPDSDKEDIIRKLRMVMGEMGRRDFDILNHPEQAGSVYHTERDRLLGLLGYSDGAPVIPADPVMGASVSEMEQMGPGYEDFFSEIRGRMPDPLEGGYYDRQISELERAREAARSGIEDLYSIRMENAGVLGDMRSSGLDDIESAEADVRSLLEGRVQNDPSEIEMYMRGEILSPEQVRSRQNAEALARMAEGFDAGEIVSGLAAATRAVGEQRDIGDERNMALMQEIAQLEQLREDRNFDALLRAEEMDVAQRQRRLDQQIQQQAALMGIDESRAASIADLAGTMISEVGDAVQALGLDAQIDMQNQEIERAASELALQVATGSGQEAPLGAILEMATAVVNRAGDATLPAQREMFQGVLSAIAPRIESILQIPQGSLAAQIASGGVAPSVGGTAPGGFSVDSSIGVPVSPFGN